MKHVIYDIEIYKNYFLFVAQDIETNEISCFELSQRYDYRYHLLSYLKSLDLMIGFNNLQFDYPLLHTFIKYVEQNQSITTKELVTRLYDRCQELINCENPYKNIVHKPKIPQLDLFKIHHFDNKAKMTSLKSLQFYLRMENIQELPFKPGTLLKKEELDVVIDYCKNDILATRKLYDDSQQSIELRKKLSKMYNLNLTNDNEPKIGEKILLSYLKKDNANISGTVRESINLGEIILPYVKFKSPEFNAIKDWLSSKVISGTKGLFIELSKEDVEILLPHSKLVDNDKYIMKTLNVVYNDFQYDFGLGGIHGCIFPGVYTSDNDYIIVDIDVTSFYPNLAIVNKMSPEQFGETFGTVYKSIFETRKQYPKGSVENLGLKLSLNGAYGHVIVNI